MAINKAENLNRAVELPLIPPVNASAKAIVKVPVKELISMPHAALPPAQKHLKQQALQAGALLHELINYQKQCEMQLIEHLEAGFLQAELEQSAALQRAALKHQASRPGEVYGSQRLPSSEQDLTVAHKAAPRSDQVLGNGDEIGRAFSPAEGVITTRVEVNDLGASEAQKQDPAKG
jgi:hypothetical protein